MKNKFNESDKDKIIDFLNIVADKAEFTLKTRDAIKYYHLLSYMQNELLPKVEDNILEVTRVIESKKEE